MEALGESLEEREPEALEGTGTEPGSAPGSGAVLEGRSWALEGEERRSAEATRQQVKATRRSFVVVRRTLPRKAR